MTSKEVNMSQLATAIMWWLSYTSAVGRNYVLSEGAIKFPASEYLERSNILDIQLEYSHPKLSRKRFDLFFERKKKEKTVFEFKYIKNGSTRTKDEKQRVFNDLMRLSLFLKEDQNGYFLICGNQNDFIKDFQKILARPKGADENIFINPNQKRDKSTNTKAEGFYTEWFSFDLNDSEKIIDLNTSVDDYKKIYNNFITEYSGSYKSKVGLELTCPDRLKTNLVFLSGSLEDKPDFSQPSKIGIWKIESYS